MRRADHPHGRGENLFPRGVSPFVFGPSPRAWGKRGRNTSRVLHSRTIPTGVGKTGRPGHGHGRRADHPHGRGENNPTLTRQANGCGPSPRAWGKRAVRRPLPSQTRTIPTAWGKPGHGIPTPVCHRTIPTGVGKTHIKTKCQGRIPDHPHGRGENAEVGEDGGKDGGPSPRAWGKQPTATPNCACARTIPTGVGKTSAQQSVRGQVPDHPHGRGENARRFTSPCGLVGPSPRAWGKRLQHFSLRPRQRTIPTGVGKTRLCDTGGNERADHPHGRGENKWKHGKIEFQDGPSPRAWGKRLKSEPGRCPTRTIPTGVGKTPRDRHRSGGFPDHPHGRGENSYSIYSAGGSNGPSPRAWGKPSCDAAHNQPRRTIPTGVGKTIVQKAGNVRRTDHPHGRGENSTSIPRPSTNSGPSPRAWGKPTQGPLESHTGRTIPTGVGKTHGGMYRHHLHADHPHGRGENGLPMRTEMSKFGPSPRAWGKHSA